VHLCCYWLKHGQRFLGQRVREISIYGFGYFSPVYITGHLPVLKIRSTQRKHINIYWLYFWQFKPTIESYHLADDPVVKMSIDSLWPKYPGHQVSIQRFWFKYFFRCLLNFSALGSFSHLARKFKMTHFLVSARRSTSSKNARSCPLINLIIPFLYHTWF